MRGFIRFGPKQLGWLAIAAVVALPAFQVDSASAQEKKYRFVMVSHIGSNDANMGWLTRSLKVFEEKYPDVETEYISTNQYSIQDHVRLLEQAIATNPDGLAVPIVSSEAFDGPLRKAIEKGIPVVAFNIPDQRPKEERIPYLTYVGGDEYLTGKLLGDYTVEHAKPARSRCRQKCYVHSSTLRIRVNRRAARASRTPWKPWTRRSRDFSLVPIQLEDAVSCKRIFRRIRIRTTFTPVVGRYLGSGVLPMTWA